MTRSHRPGSVRTSLRRTVPQRIRQAWTTKRVGSVGDGAYVERNVQFLRHPRNITLGANTIVKEGTRICPANSDATISVGDWTTIGYHTHIFATGSISIGASCLIAPFCYLVDSDHGIDRSTLIRVQPMSWAPIVLADDVWLGARVVVLAGTNIGEGAVVAAASVVSGEVPEYAIMRGNPAVQVGERRSKDHA